MISPSNNPVPVLVVGAGPAGLTLALSLLENGVSVRIVAKETSHRVGIRGSTIMPRTQEALELLGLFPELGDEVKPLPPMQLYATPHGTEIIKTLPFFDPIEPTPTCPYTTPMVLAQNLLEGLLRKRLAERFGVHVELGKELMDFTQDENGVTARLKTTTAGNQEGVEEVVRADYLAGADGGRSRVRKTLGLSFLGETRSANWLIYGDVEVKGLDPEHWHMWGGGLGPNGVTLRPPDGTNAKYWLYLATSTEGMSDDEVLAVGNDTKLAEEYFRKVSGRTDVQFGEWVYNMAHRPNIRMADTFQKGRVFLCGDAGHTHSVAGGQGLNSSIQDSVNLAWKLALVLKGRSSSSLLDSYNAERLPVIAEMLQHTTVLLDRNGSESYDTAGASTVDPTNFKRGPAFLQLGVNYRWSSIVVDQRTPKPDIAEAAYSALGAALAGPVRAGDRAPDASELCMAGAVRAMRLFNLFAPTRHTALVFASKSADFDEAVGPFLQALQAQRTDTVRTIGVFPQGTGRDVTLRGADAVVVDEAAHARTAYNVGEHDGIVVAIVRPDGVVGGILTGAQGVNQYFSSIFP